MFLGWRRHKPRQKLRFNGEGVILYNNIAPNCPREPSGMQSPRCFRTREDLVKSASRYICKMVKLSTDTASHYPPAYKCSHLNAVLKNRLLLSDQPPLLCLQNSISEGIPSLRSWHCDFRQISQEGSSLRPCWYESASATCLQGHRSVHGLVQQCRCSLTLWGLSQWEDQNFSSYFNP